jgi:serine/threonine protein kinase
MELAKCFWELGKPDPVEHLGALKRFVIPTDDREEALRAIGRLESEIRALQNVSHPAVLKLLHSNSGERFIVTEYHPRGTLARNLNPYRGNTLAALEAFKTLVEGVVEIHEQDAIHRDIKPENVFVATSGNLVLGDFGIVFFQAGEGERLTSTYERVGSHYWMAPWAYGNVRLKLSQIRYSLDIYPLGKVLWSMISGRNGFPFWEYDREENNLEKIFPDDPNMPLVNSVLAKCVVREEKACHFSTAKDMQLEVEHLIEQIKSRRGPRPDGAQTWSCGVCGKGTYHPASPSTSMPLHLRRSPLMLAQIPGSAQGDLQPFSIFVCDYCGHAELFKAY